MDFVNAGQRMTRCRLRSYVSKQQLEVDKPKWSELKHADILSVSWRNFLSCLLVDVDV